MKIKSIICFFLILIFNFSIKINAKDQIIIVLDNQTIYGNNSPAIYIKENSNYLIKIKGQNKLVGDNNFAGIYIPNSSSLTIEEEGKGYLEVYGGDGGAGIGGNKAISKNDSFGEIIIKSGTIKSFGGDGAAGMGNGSWGYAAYDKSRLNIGHITINGGNITSLGGNNAAGIGGGNWSNGGNIIISEGFIEAKGGGSSAGIGGGNHGDGGNIVISNGIINSIGGSGGAGIGSGLGSSKISNINKGAGYYYGGNITINGGNINSYGGWNASGIGGGIYCDSGKVVINNGEINAFGGEGTLGSLHHGASGIGGGYEGHAIVEINGGTIKTAGANSGSGIGSGGVAKAFSSVRSDNPDVVFSVKTIIKIKGGDIISSKGGTSGASGIGAGISSDFCDIEILGGRIRLSEGEKSNNNDMLGGAAIGSSAYRSDLKYAGKTEVNISISGDAVIDLAIGGFGASGIGSGAKNISANSVIIKGTPQLTVFSDGTKFAIDTREKKINREKINSKIIQGTFMNKEDLKGLNISIENINSKEDKKELFIPENYRSFATTVKSEDKYVVYDLISYFAYNKYEDQRDEDYHIDDALNTIYYIVKTSEFSDNYYLYRTDLKLERVQNGLFLSTGDNNFLFINLFTIAFILEIFIKLIKKDNFLKYYLKYKK